MSSLKPAGTHRTLADYLRSLSDDALVDLVRRRPDLATPLPGDFTAFAQRAHSPHSVARALDQLDRFTLEILDGLRVPAHHCTLGELHQLVGKEADELAVRRALRRLEELVLIWPQGDGWHAAGAIAEVRGPYPAGLGRPLTQLTSDHNVDDVLTALPQAPPAAVAMLQRLAAGPPIGSIATVATGHDASVESPSRWSLQRGLLVRVQTTGDGTLVELPREVGLALRGNSPLGELHPQPPALNRQHPGVEAIDAAGCAAVLDLVRQVESIVDECAIRPPGALRAGGMAQRDLRRLAGVIGGDEATVAVLIEVCHAAGLLDRTASIPGEWLPTPFFDHWRTDGVALRWATLAIAWLEMARLPHLAGERDDRSRRIAPLSYEVGRPHAPHVRNQVLAVLAELPPGDALRNDAVIALLNWRSSRQAGPSRDAVYAAVLTEATMVALIGRGGLTSFGRALVEGIAADAAVVGLEKAVARLHDVLPEPIDYVLVQADLTVVAPGYLNADLAGELALVAELESAGAATVYRVTGASIRRALDAGRTSAELHELFTKRSRTPVPQALSYLIDDVARRHGGLRVGTAGSYLRSDDSALLAAMIADRRCAILQLRQLAPTVVVSPMSRDRLMPALAELGYPASLEDATGALVVAQPHTRRTPMQSRPSAPTKAVTSLDEDALRQGLAILRRSDEAASAMRRVEVKHAPEVPTEQLDTVRMLRMVGDAVRNKAHIRLGYIDAHGGVRRRLVRAMSVGAGYLRAEDERTETVHTFALHRIVSVTLEP